MDINKLRDLKKLLEEGIITQEEFDVEKEKIISFIYSEKGAAKKKGKGIASMVLGIFACFISIAAIGSVSTSELTSIAELFGYNFIQLTSAIISISLACSERKNNKNGFNTSGLWLAISSFILIGFTFIVGISYF